MAAPQPPVIVDTDVAPVLAWYQQYYFNATGVQLAPGAPEMLIINAIANREVTNRALWQQIAISNLLDFATGPILDYIAALVGVTRLQATPAEVDIQFNIISGANAVTIPAGTRVQSNDGQVIFATPSDNFIPSGTASVIITCTANTAGSQGNGYAANNVSLILDPLPFITSAVNTDTSAGGSDQETDPQLIARTKLANSTFSVAGPKNAYKYWAKTANPLIIDVGVTNPTPGQANIYPLVAGVTPTPDEILNQVQAILSPDDIRPMCDTVVVESPTANNYALVVNITKLTGGVDAQIQADVQAALAAYSSNTISQLGVDVVANQIVALVMEVTNVYDCNLNGFTTIALNDDESQYCNCTGITVNIIGTH